MKKASHSQALLRKAGFTLVELLVYIAIVGIVVIVAGQAFSNSTKMRIRTQNMLKASEVAENVAALFKADVAQMGAKTAMSTTGGSATSDAFYLDAIPHVYMDPNNADADDKKDSSSYAVGKTDAAHDTLVFRRIRYNDAGAYEAVERIIWKTNDSKILLRSCETLEGTGNTSCPKNTPLVVEMATGVDTFKVTPATPGTTEAAAVLFPATPTPASPSDPVTPASDEFKLIPRYGVNDLYYLNVTPAEGASSVALTGFATNYDFENQVPLSSEKKGNQVFLGAKNSTTGTWENQCTRFSLSSNEEYEISFTMPYSDDASRMFVPGRDHMAVGLRNADNGERPAEIDDFLFFPPTMSGASAGKRSMRFSVKQPIADLCIAFTFATYSPIAANGSVKFENIVFKKVESANSRFDNATIAISEKKNVKAMQLKLSVSKGSTGNSRGESSNLTMVVQTPSNGPRD